MEQQAAGLKGPEGEVGNDPASRIGKEMAMIVHTPPIVRQHPAAASRQLPGISGPITLRVSVTDRCNFRCHYCMPSNGIAFEKSLPPLEKLFESIAFLAEHFTLDKIKLTGGEPLVRRGVVGFVQQLKKLPGIHEISMTTNGSLLSSYASDLKNAGLARVNVSLDSLDSTRFRELTNGGSLEATLSGIDDAIFNGLVPLKLNAVLMRNSWQKDVPNLLDFAAERGIELRFIELMRTGTGAEWAKEEYVPARDIVHWLEDQSEVRPIGAPASSPAKRTEIIWKGRHLAVGWITPLSVPFCTDCNRLRIDALGQVRRCLMDPSSFGLLASLNEHGPALSLQTLENYMRGKQLPTSIGSENPMSRVGG